MTITPHAQKRINRRRISQDAIDAALRWGREIFQRRAIFYVIGKKEVRAAKKRGVDLKPHEGIHVVVNPKTDAVETVYRNASLDLKRHSYESG